MKERELGELNRVLLPRKLLIQPMITCFASLIIQLQKRQPDSLIEEMRLEENGFLTIRLMAAQNDSFAKAEPVRRENGGITFGLKKGIKVSDAVLVLQQVIKSLYYCKNNHQNIVKQVNVNQGLCQIDILKDNTDSQKVIPMTSKREETFMILDGSNIMNRGWYATTYKNTEHLMQTSKGIYVNAVYGFVEILLKLVRTYKPTHLLVAWDTDRENIWRRKKYLAYKANRGETDPILKGQFPLAQEILDGMGVHQIRGIDGYEADEIVGTLSRKWSQEHPGKCLIVSNDHDLFQLLDDNISSILRGNKGDQIYLLSDFQKEYAVSPDQWPAVKGLLGDRGDNLPGVAGVGDKAVAPLISAYGSLEGVYDNLEALASTSFKRYIKKLQDGKTDAFLTEELARIVDVPTLVEYSPDDCKLRMNRNAMIKAFEKFEFNTLIERIS